MDSKHFDHLARTLHSRRAIVGVLLGGVAALLRLAAPDVATGHNLLPVLPQARRPGQAPPLSAPGPGAQAQSYLSARDPGAHLQRTLRHPGQQLRPGGDLFDLSPTQVLPEQRQLRHRLFWSDLPGRLLLRAGIDRGREALRFEQRRNLRPTPDGVLGHHRLPGG